MSTTTQQPAFDIWLLPALAHHDTNPKDLLRDVPTGARLAIGGGAVAILREFPMTSVMNVDRIANQLWARLREQTFGDPSGRTVGLVLSRGTAGPVLELDRVLRLLLACGNFKETLLAQKRQIDEQLALLNQTEQVAR